MNDLKIFNNDEFGAIRTVTDKLNNVWFVGKDVADILGYVDLNKAIAMHVDDDDKLNAKTASSLGQRGGWLINESGLYSLVLTSKLPNAKKFKRWVTSEVLPTIRKTGGYIQTDSEMTDADIMAKALLVAHKTIEEREKRLAEKEKQLIRQRPMVEFAERVIESSDTVGMGEFAKLACDEGINIGRNRLVKWLKDNRILMSDNTPYQQFIDRGYFEVVKAEKKTIYGQRYFPTTVITGKGQIWLMNKLSKEYSENEMAM